MNSSCRLSNMALIYCKIPPFTDLLLEPCSMLQSLTLNLVLQLTKYVSLWLLLLSLTGQLWKGFWGALHSGLILYPTSLNNHLSLRGFCDSDRASVPDDRRSTSGAAVFVGPNLVSWWSRKQKAVSRSSTEAEYRSLVAATADILWIQTLLLELAVPHSIPIMLCDNSSALQLAHNPVLHARTKHMELNVFFVREKVLTKQLVVQHIPGTDQWEDLLTKPVFY